MGRPPLHSADDFVDAATRLFAEGGIRALTMNAVAREISAPSGSIYHRFPDRAALLAAVWFRTTGDFQHGYLDVLGGPVTPANAVRAAVWTVHWCRSHLSEAVVLQAGVRTFEPDQWPEAARTELAARDENSKREIDRAIRLLAKETGRPADQIAFAMLDLPLAAVRRHLLAGEVPPKRTDKLVREMAGLLLAVPGD
jgi:AcrR family transcriptional regulator